jgi:hypothetical protein
MLRVTKPLIASTREADGVLKPKRDEVEVGSSIDRGTLSGAELSPD